MKPIELTDAQKDKLLEMTRKLFHEYKSIKFWNFDSYDDFSGLGGNEKINNCIAFYPEELPVSNENPPRIEWSKVQDTNIPLTIHWFEFCMTWLPERLYPLYDTMINGTGADFELDMFNWCIDCKKQHPIDYLYKQFKELK